MAIVLIEELKLQLNITDDEDNDVLEQKIASAQDHIERLLGFKIETKYPDETPPALKEAVLQLASWWYEQRESVLVGLSAKAIPFGIQDIVQEYKEWSFGADA